MGIDVLCVAVLAWVCYRVADEGAWGAWMVFLSVLLSGLFAMNLFEPLAELLALKISSAEAWQARWDVVSLLGLFGGGVFLLRILTERLAPARMGLPLPLEFGFRWAGGLATGYLTMAILLTALHVAPLPRAITSEEVLEVAGFLPEREMVFGLAPDRQWLKFNQRLSRQALNRGDYGRLFDGPIYRSGGQSGHWPSFPLRYADRRERLTRSRLGL